MSVILLNKKPHRLGFTLTELGIVIGVAGMVMGAIWVSASSVYNNHKAKVAAGEVQQILTNYRKLYSQHAIDMTNWTDITCIGINGNFFPAEMMPVGITCAPSVSGAATFTSTNVPPMSLQTPWGGTSYVNVAAFQDFPGIIITYGNLTETACEQLANAITISQDVAWENVDHSGSGDAGAWVNGYDGVASVPILTPSGIHTACSATSYALDSTTYSIPTNGHIVQVMYTVK